MNHYEIVIWANVSDPSYKDKAIIYVNAIEKARGNQSVTSAKITFAEDLLSSNPECIELNEFIRQAKDQIDNRNYEQASNILDSVIQGCKYLVSQSRLKDERPTGFTIGINLDSVPYLKPILIVFFILLTAGIVLTFKLKKANEKEPS
jgi:hypothetical protein